MKRIEMDSKCEMGLGLNIKWKLRAAKTFPSIKGCKARCSNQTKHVCHVR